MGIIDPLSPLAEVSSAENLWLHTDAAWAGAIALSDDLRPLLAGIERSDSVTLDAHKWLSVPMGTGVILSPHQRLLAQVFSVSTSYMPAEIDDAADPCTTSMQWSRRFAGLKIFLSLAMHGRRGYVAQLEHDVDLGATLSRRLAAEGGTDQPDPASRGVRPRSRRRGAVLPAVVGLARRHCAARTAVQLHAG